MTQPESSVGTERAFDWKVYSVRKRDKVPLLNFIIEALEMRGCKVLETPRADRAPFYIIFETPAGERHGLLAYAFLANSKPIKNRPKDEHRFQVKYGGRLSGILEVSVDPYELITTIFLGINLERNVFVAADPVMNEVLAMSSSIEFKAHNVEEIARSGWCAWERDRREPKSNRRRALLEEDPRIQVLVGGTQDRLLDLIQLERLARDLDPGERNLLADKLAVRTASTSLGSHKLIKELGIPPEALFELIDGTSRLKMAVRGWVAETHLEEALRKLPQVSDCRRLTGEGQPDLTLRWKGCRPVLVECKNVLRKLSKDALPRVDFQRTRAAKGDPCSRYYQPADFTVLAACLHAVTEQWRFSFALTADMPPHRRCNGRIDNNVTVDAPLFTMAPELVFDKCSH